MSQAEGISGGNEEVELSADLPFELSPVLQANGRAAYVFDRLRDLKRQKDAIEKEFDELRTEAGVLVSVAQAKSVAYIDLRVANTEPGKAPMKITGASAVEQLEANSEFPATYQQIRAIALAAKDCDPDILAQYGYPVNRIDAARKPSGKPRAASTRVEWIGAKGKGGKERAAGSGDSVQ